MKIDWKKYLLPSGLVLALAATLAIAQNINRAIQLSQDPTGVIGVDSNNNIYFPNHILTTGGPPTLTSCGTAPTVTGSDQFGTVVMGTGAAPGCIVTFRQAYLSTPYCILQVQNPATSPLAYTPSTTALTVTSAGPGTTFNYICSGSR